MRPLSRTLPLLLLTVLLAACGSAASGPDVVQPQSSDDDGAVGPPVLQVEHVGGLLPAGAAFASVPELTVYDDGRAVVPGPQPAIFPGPALPNLRVHELGDAAVQRLIERAREAGLLAEPPGYGDGLPVADATTTRVVLSVAGEQWVHEAYALGFDAQLPGAPQPDAGLPSEVRQARERLTAFLADARSLVEQAGAGSAYVPEAFALTTLPAPTEPAEVERQVLPWPLPEVDLSSVGDCRVVTGEAADTLRATLQEADALTLFTQEGTTYDVPVRPLLPGATGC